MRKKDVKEKVLDFLAALMVVIFAVALSWFIVTTIVDVANAMQANHDAHVGCLEHGYPRWDVVTKDGVKVAYCIGNTSAVPLDELEEIGR